MKNDLEMFLGNNILVLSEIKSTRGFGWPYSDKKKKA